MQTAQECYQRATEKEKKKSEWRENIEKKIRDLTTTIELLWKKGEGKELSKEEVKEARRIMREKGLIMDKPRELAKVKMEMEEKKRIYEDKIRKYGMRIEYSRQNRRFELYRGRFYRDMEGEGPREHEVSKEEIKGFWDTMWKEEGMVGNEADEYLLEFITGDEEQIVFPSFEEFRVIIEYLPNWKAAGVDSIYNYFNKKLTSIHQDLYRIIKEICLESKEQDDRFYQGITYLVPKGTPKSGSEFRPITCMSNLYKLPINCATKVMQETVEQRELLSGKQMVTVRRVQGAKEQALTNIAINRTHGNKLKTAWIDVKKAYDSVNHGYLIKCI
jgi:hypothetical protein